MKMEILSRLYLACSCEDSYVVEGFDLSSLYKRDEAVDNAERAFSNCLFGAGDTGKLEHLHNVACMAYEGQGFINGFRLGMKLAQELAGEEAAGE